VVKENLISIKEKEEEKEKKVKPKVDQVKMDLVGLRMHADHKNWTPQV
jgi:hypothetical protein